MNLNVDMKSITIALLIFCLLLSTAVYAQQPVFHNPVINSDFPDPTVIKATDGRFYAYATQTRLNGKWINIQVAVSPDGYNWKIIGDALPVKPVWANHTQDFLGATCVI